ncbi:uncharacterized protein ColSpa_05235 [Colletotrichum spaethianum]|uniref:Uncharacterized protein n=1 Tax=Colletotrichum spaethianum TaxID=700344 RepID=A0AA37LCY8_9PEZI|nr:uncharacterized protein ColSpa_05235 [Colletotrichum spaethianum]GKT45054.1 hypothetical protein ColSpa_05235 [Colletotrichum spaethianum]
MVVFVDLDEDMEPLHVLEARRLAAAAAVATDALEPSSRELNHELEKPTAAPVVSVAPVPAPEPTPTFQSAVTEAFGCYPIVMSIAEHIDLNTLDSLARTSRQVRRGLLQYRSILLSSTLHCSNEDAPVDPESTFRFRARAGNWYYMEDGRNYNGKSGSCARDLVTECRRCRTVVCRGLEATVEEDDEDDQVQLIADAANRTVLSSRQPTTPSASDIAGCVIRAPRPQSPRSLISPWNPKRLFWMTRCDGKFAGAISTASGSANHVGGACAGPTTTISGLFSIWKWRAHYGEVLGGLGTGIGEGDRGVICGRESACAGAKERENETDCDAEDAAVSGANLWTATDQVHLDTVRYERTPSPQLGPGYERHEIEGIGGCVKTKLIRMVRVGACVPEWDDEKSHHNILGREVKGNRRSWCGWCYRVVPGEADLETAGVQMRQL